MCDLTCSAELEEVWILNPAYAKYQNRIKITVSGTRHSGYLDGEYEGKRGRVVAAIRAASDFEQSVTIRFDNGDQRPILIQYVTPVKPSWRGDEALVLIHKERQHKGKEVIVRENVTEGEDDVPVSTQADPLSVFSVKTEHLAALYPVL
jgi:transcription elongation factor SPT5